jgi:hypothetical protein
VKILLKVSSSNEHWDSDCELALVELTAELAGLALQRIAALREQKSADPDIDESYYWAYFAEYFSPWINRASTTDTDSAGLMEIINDLQIDGKEIVTVPDSFQVPPSQVAAVECQQMIVREDSVAFMAIPKHAGFYVHTVEISLGMLEAAADASKLRG